MPDTAKRTEDICGNVTYEAIDGWTYEAASDGSVRIYDQYGSLRSEMHGGRLAALRMCVERSMKKLLG